MIVLKPVPPPPYFDALTNAWGGPAGSAVTVHPLPNENGVIVKVHPPKAPRQADEKLSHVPCDIALVIDVSGSMDAEAPMPRNPDEETNDAERTGLSVLDLVKHSCRTILSSMDERDRLAIIKFSSRTKVLQGLKFTTEKNKKKALKNIEALQPEGSTNLWHAIKAGIDVFQKTEQVGNVPAIMVLTDGRPNHMCPPQGYVPALRDMDPIVPAIHTFGFGYQLRSGLLKSIAEFGGGNYAFIPDAGMIGTTFIHAVANLQSTFVTDASLNLNCPGHIVLEETTGPYVKKQTDTKKHPFDGKSHLTIPLGAIQYGQSRDIYLQWTSTNSGSSHSDLTSPLELNVTLQYGLLEEGAARATMARVSLESTHSIVELQSDSAPITAEEVAYHVSRARICAFLTRLFPIDSFGEHRVDEAIGTGFPALSSPGLEGRRDELAQLIQSLPAAQYPEDARCRSLVQDLNGSEPFGQISMALSTFPEFRRWGQHYLPSLHGAHAHQLCNNFKDPGPLQYGTESPLFVQCRDELNRAFDNLPPPAPSLMVGGGVSSWWHDPGQPRAPPDAAHLINDPLYRIRGGPVPPSHDFPGPSDHLVSDSNYTPLSRFSETFNLSSNPCFAAHTLVELSSGQKTRMQDLKEGMSLVTPLGPRSVAAVLATPVKEEWMINLDGVIVTPWHPVTLDTTGLSPTGWRFPCLMVTSHPVLLQYTGCIYSVLLQRDDNVDAHALLLGGPGQDDAGAAPFWGVTLGHGLVAGADIRAHGFFGDYSRVLESLVGLAVRDDGCLLTGGVRKCQTTGLACGFKKAREPLAIKCSFSGLVHHKKQTVRQQEVTVSGRGAECLASG